LAGRLAAGLYSSRYSLVSAFSLSSLLWLPYHQHGIIETRFHPGWKLSAWHSIFVDPVAARTVVTSHKKRGNIILDGVADFLEKPVRPLALVAAVRRLVLK
jgi:hypothetical protein